MDEVDRLRNLPECLIFHILMNLPTKDVVRTSVLSSRWRNLWRYVPGLDLVYKDFPEFNVFVRFVYRYLGFDRESSIQKFKLKCSSKCDKEFDLAHLTRWIDTVLKRKVQHLHVFGGIRHDVLIPPTVYSCDTLVSLKLWNIYLPNPEFVSLPSVKVIDLVRVKFANDLAFEMLISGCSVLEILYMWRKPCDNINDLRVCSKSLLSFSLHDPGLYCVSEDTVVAIDAPMLEYLKLNDYKTARFVISNAGSLAKVDINIVFNLIHGMMFDPSELPKIKIDMIRNFFLGISSVKDMLISSQPLEVLYNYLRCQPPLPLFRNLSSMRATTYNCHMFPHFLESCPNLKSLYLEITSCRNLEAASIFPRRRCFLSSLEYVEIKSFKKPLDMKIASYFLQSSTILKKLSIYLVDYRKKEESVILETLLTIPRLSTSCQVVVSSM